MIGTAIDPFEALALAAVEFVTKLNIDLSHTLVNDAKEIIEKLTIATRADVNTRYARKLS